MIYEDFIRARDFPIQENPTITRVSRQVLSGLGNPVLTQ